MRAGALPVGLVGAEALTSDLLPLVRHFLPPAASPISGPWLCQSLRLAACCRHAALNGSIGRAAILLAAGVRSGVSGRAAGAIDGERRNRDGQSPLIPTNRRTPLWT